MPAVMHRLFRPALAALLLLPLFQAGPVLVDRVVARVDDRILTLHDIERTLALFPVARRDDESEPDIYARTLDDLVTQAVMALEYSDEFTLAEEDFEVVQRQILQKAGSWEQLMAVLARFGMNWDDLKAFIRNRVLYEKVLREKFPLEFAVAFADIEAFYERDYLPSQRQLGLEPRSLADMTPQIEAYLRQQRRASELAAWLAEIRQQHRIEVKLRSLP